jgi:hypothetical protein
LFLMNTARIIVAAFQTKRLRASYLQIQREVRY